jgi:hypothetical protein
LDHLATPKLKKLTQSNAFFVNGKPRPVTSTTLSSHFNKTIKHANVAGHFFAF